MKKQDYGMVCKWCHSALLAFPLMTPVQALAKMKVSDGLRHDVLQAAKVARGARKPIPTTFHMAEVTGYEISSVCDMMTVAQFEQTYKMSAKAAGVKTVQLTDAQGQSGTYILIRPPAGKEQLQLKLFSRVDLDVDRTVLGSALRESQSGEVRQAYTKDLEKLGQFPSDIAMLTTEQITSMVAAKRVADELAQATQALESQAPKEMEVEQAKPEEPAQEVEEEEEDDDDDDDESLDNRVLLPSEIEKKKKEAAKEAKRRAKGKGKCGKRAGKGPSPPAKRPRLSLQDTASVASQGSASLQKLDAKSILEG